VKNDVEQAISELRIRLGCAEAYAGELSQRIVALKDRVDELETPKE